jgi:endonuclease YncB( thermonuclease family)
MNVEEKTKNENGVQIIHEKSELKPCPKCRKPNHKDARICTCGFWLKTEDFLQASQLPQIRKERFKNKIKKTAAATVFIIVCGWLVLYWNGYGVGISTASLENDVEKTENSDQSNASDARSFFDKKTVARGIIEGKVVAVNSGELITVSDKDNKNYEVRLGGIDAPDVSEEFGEQSKKNLSDLILNKDVQVLLQNVEENGRLVGKVLHNGKNINLEQIGNGAAKHNINDADEQTEADRKIYADTEMTAKNAGTGIWSSVKEKDALPEQDEKF